MARQSVLDPVTAQKLKADMFNGMPHAEIQTKYGVTYQMSSNIKNGRAYPEVPWPDGSTGPMAHMRSAALRQERKYTTNVNNNRAHGGGHYMAPEEDDMWSLHLKRKGIPLDTPSPLNNGNTLLYDLRYGWPHLIPAVQRMKERQHEEWERKQMEEVRKYAAESAKEPTKSPEQLAEERKELLRKQGRDQCDPEKQELMDWDYILSMSKGVVAVEVAEAGDVAMKYAIQIVFKNIPPKYWGEQHTLRNLAFVKEQILTFWERNPDHAPCEGDSETPEITDVAAE
jgi:hypothetical protein